MITGSLPRLVEDNNWRMLRDEFTLMRRSSMRCFQKSIESRMISRYLILLTMGIGVLLHVEIASTVLKGQSRETADDDLWTESRKFHQAFSP